MPYAHARRWGSWTVALGLLAGACALGGSASAALPEEAREPYESGKKALRAGNHDEALGHFHEGLRLVAGEPRPTWQFLVAVAFAYERMGEAEHALQYYRRFLDHVGEHPEALNAKWRKRRKVARESVDELRASLLASRGRLRVRSSPAGGELYLDGERAGARGDAETPYVLYPEPGEHRIRVTLSGGRRAERVVEVRSGKRAEVHLEPRKASAQASDEATAEGEAAEAAGTSASRGDEDEGDASDRPGSESSLSVTREQGEVDGRIDRDRIGPGVTMGTGAALIVTASVLSARAASAQSVQQSIEGPIRRGSPAFERWLEQDAKRRRNERASWGLYVVGGAGVAAGFAWLMFDVVGDRSEDAAATSARVGAVPARGGGRITARWSF